MPEVLNFDMFKLAKGRKILFLNIRSLMANINELRYCLENSNISICGICETWLNKKLHNNLIAINGFNTIRLDRKTGKRGGGLLFYINNSFKYELLDQEDLSSTYSDKNIEMLSIVVKPEKQRNMVFTVVYIPPSANKNMALHDLSERLINTNPNNKYYQLIGGDFNIDYNHNTCNSESKLLDIFESKLNLLQLITVPTRTSARKASIIDLIYTSNNNIISDSGVIQCNFSDHDFVYTIFKKQPSKKRKLPSYTEI